MIRSSPIKESDKNMLIKRHSADNDEEEIEIKIGRNEPDEA